MQALQQGEWSHQQTQPQQVHTQPYQFTQQPFTPYPAQQFASHDPYNPGNLTPGGGPYGRVAAALDAFAGAGGPGGTEPVWTPSSQGVIQQHPHEYFQASLALQLFFKSDPSGGGTPFLSSIHMFTSAPMGG